MKIPGCVLGLPVHFVVFGYGLLVKPRQIFIFITTVLHEVLSLSLSLLLISRIECGLASTAVHLVRGRHRLGTFTQVSGTTRACKSHVHICKWG